MRQQHGFSSVEVLLAAVVFGMVALAIGGSFVYGQQATAGSGDRLRATALAEEGIEALRNIRDNNYANLADGTYGLVQAGNTWTTSGNSDTNGIYTRSITIASNGSNRKNITSTVSWGQPNGSTASVRLESVLANWLRNRSWNSPTLLGSADADSGLDGLKVATQGNFAYVVRSDGTPDFVVVNIANPANPVIVGSLNLAGAPNNIAVKGNYAYVATSNASGELTIVDVTNPVAPSVAALYNAPGTAAGQGITVGTNYAFLTRAANGGNAEFAIINITTPTALTLAGAYANNVSMREMALMGTYAFIVTDTGRLLVINMGNILSLLLTGNFPLAGSGNALTIAGFGTTMVVGRGNSVQLYDVSTPILTNMVGMATLPGTVNDVTIDNTNSYVFAGTNTAGGELQVINISTPNAPSIAGTLDIEGSNSMNGVAFNTTSNTLVGVTSSDNQEVITAGQN